MDINTAIFKGFYFDHNTNNFEVKEGHAVRDLVNGKFVSFIEKANNGFYVVHYVGRTVCAIASNAINNFQFYK